MAAAAAVRLIGKSSRPRGSSTARSRSGPPIVWPAVIVATNSAPPPTSANAPRLLIVGGAGSVATRPSSTGSGAVVGTRSSARSDRVRNARRAAGSFMHDVRDEARDEHPRPDVVRGVEAEPERVVVLDVHQPGDDLEQDPADEHQQRRALQRVRRRLHRRPGEQPRDHRPQLGQHHGHEDQPQRRRARPGSAGTATKGRVGQSIAGRCRSPTSPGIDCTRPVGDVIEQAGDDHQRQRGEQRDAEHGGEPRPA